MGNKSTGRQETARQVLERHSALLFRVNAVINWTTSVGGIVDPVGIAHLYGGPVPTYPWLIRLWMCFVFMFGCMFWEVARNVPDKFALMKYNWIEKTITASAITAGFALGQVPDALMLTITLTNWLWIPVLVYYDRRLARIRMAG